MFELHTPTALATKFFETFRVSKLTPIYEKISVVQTTITHKTIVQYIDENLVQYDVQLTWISVQDMKTIMDNLREYNTILKVKWPQKNFWLEELTRVAITEVTISDEPYLHQELTSLERQVDMSFKLKLI